MQWILHNNKKEQTTDTWNIMGETHKQYADSILYDSININPQLNKTNRWQKSEYWWGGVGTGV